MSFTDQKPFVVSEDDVSAHWCGYPDARNLRCAWCGHRFIVGDVARWVHTNSGADDCISIMGNPFVCARCDGPREIILARLRAMAVEAETRFWWFTQR